MRTILLDVKYETPYVTKPLKIPSTAGIKVKANGIIQPNLERSERRACENQYKLVMKCPKPKHQPNQKYFRLFLYGSNRINRPLKENTIAGNIPSGAKAVVNKQPSKNAWK